MKQKAGRKLLSFLLTLAMVVGLLPGMGLTAYATGATSGDFGAGNTLHWELSDNTLTISGTGAMPDSNYDEPYTTWQNSYSGQIKTVIISAGVTSIGKENLAYLGITSVTIPNTVTAIGDNAFNSCADLTSIELPDSITSIGLGAFNACNKLSTVNIPANVTAINGMTFASCALTSITIPAGVTCIDYNAFWNCTKLGTVTFERPSVTRGLSIGSGAFENCNATIAFSGTGTSELYDGSTKITAGTKCDTLDGDAYPADPTTKTLTWKSPHDHSFTYSANGATITATCSAEGCTLDDGTEQHNHIATLTLVKPTLETYGETGKSAAASLTGLTDFNTATGKDVKATDIKYVGRDGTTYAESATAPTNAGKYTAKITVEGKTAKVDYEIAKAATSVTTPPTASEITYGKTLVDSSLTGGTASVAGTFAWKDTTIVPAVSDSQKTEYDVVFTPTDVNYSTAECKVKLTVNKAAATVTAPTTKTLTYTGSAQELVNVGSTNDGTMYYAVTTENKAPADNLYTTSIPAKTNAGTYYVWYKVVGDANHNDIAPQCISVTISQTESEKQTEKQDTTPSGGGGGSLPQTTDPTPALTTTPSETVEQPTTTDPAITQDAFTGISETIAPSTDGTASVTSVSATVGKTLRITGTVNQGGTNYPVSSFATESFRDVDVKNIFIDLKTSGNTQTVTFQPRTFKGSEAKKLTLRLTSSRQVKFCSGALSGSKIKKVVVSGLKKKEFKRVEKKLRKSGYKGKIVKK